MKQYSFWFVVGSQFLYGPEVLDTVAKRAAQMAEELSRVLPYPLLYKVTAKTNQEIAAVVKEANHDDACAGIITWCHTFSPSKMWINGFVNLQKPYCHFATQYNREIPNEEIDMDFMNLNQAAHGDREHGFIAARLRMPRKIIAGHWQDPAVRKRIAGWMRAAVGVSVSRGLKVMRFGDNMREVAVTEGDKVEVQAKLGWQVNTWAVGDLVKVMNAVTDAEIDALMDTYKANYDIATENVDAIRYQAREEIAMKKMLDAGVPIEHITFSSDGQGSLPVFNREGENIDVQVARVDTLYQEVRDAVRQENIPLETALRTITSNVADHLRLSHKGRVREGNDADLVLADPDTLEIQTVIAQGQIMLRDGELLVKGSFE